MAILIERMDGGITEVVGTIIGLRNVAFRIKNGIKYYVITAIWRRDFMGLAHIRVLKLEH